MIRFVDTGHDSIVVYDEDKYVALIHISHKIRTTPPKMRLNGMRVTYEPEEEKKIMIATHQNYVVEVFREGMED